MLIGALGCNLAWGIIDAVMYLMDCFSGHAGEIVALRAVRNAAKPTALSPKPCCRLCRR